MGLTLFSIILILIFVRILTIGDAKKQFMLSVVVTMICSIVINMGYFVKMSNDSTIPFSTISWIVCTFFAYRLNHKPLHISNVLTGDIQRKIKIYIICIFITAILFYVFRYDGVIVKDNDYEHFIKNEVGYTHLRNSSFKYGYVYISMMLCYVLYTIHKNLNNKDLLYIGDKFISITWISVIIGYVEFLTENLFQTLMVTESSILMFGNSGSQQVLLNFDRGWSNIQGFTKEASMYSTSLFYSLIIAINMISIKSKKRKYAIYIAAVFLLLLLNTSMSSYVYAFISILFILYVRPFSKGRRTNPKVVLLLLILLAILLTSQTVLSHDSYLSTRLNRSLLQFSGFSDSDFDTSSEGIRYMGIYHCFSVFINRPFFGVGMGCVTCVSGIVSLLVSIGSVGTIAYINLIMPKMQTGKLDKYFIVTFLVIVPNLFLNDLGTMFAAIIPFSLLLTNIVLKKNN